MVDILKLDMVEASILTGTGDLTEAAALDEWGSRETVVIGTKARK